MNQFEMALQRVHSNGNSNTKGYNLVLEKKNSIQCIIIHFIIKRNIFFATSKVFIDYLSFLFKIIQLQLTLYKNFRSQTSDDKNFRFRFIGNPVFFSWQVAHRDLHVRTPVGKINWSDQLFSFISGLLLYLLCY